MSEPVVDSSSQKPTLRKADPREYRATFGVAYPIDIAELRSPQCVKDHGEQNDVGDQRLQFIAKKVVFGFSFKTLDKINFSKCNFHHKNGLEHCLVQHLTFDDCRFDHCMMGTTIYKSVRFKGCKFISCDFQNGRFQDCVFEECEFESCTCMEVRFESTEVSPKHFLKAIVFPAKNFQSTENQQNLEKYEKEWPSIRLQTARQILKSNMEIHHTKYVDDALHLVKQCELKNGGLGPFGKIWLSLHLILTDGGTSFYKLSILAFLVALVTALCLLGSDVSFFGMEVNLASPTYWLAFFGACGAFFGFGFTALQTSQPYMAAVLLCVAFLGLVWYAMAIPVLVRRVYR